MNPSRLLMPLAFASSMGGMMTLIGTPPNLVIQNALTSAGFPPLSFFSFFPVGIICVAVGTLVLLPLSKWFLSKRGKNGEDNVHSGKSLKQLVKEYGLSSNLFRLRVVGDSRLHGKTIIELDIRRKYGLNILEVRRGDMSQHRFLKTITQKLADPGTVLQKEDILYVTGDFEKIKLFAEDYLLEMLDEHTTEEAKNSANSLDFYDIGIAEIVLMPSSNLINQTIKGAGFRDKFNVNVLGIRRKKEYLLQDLGNERIHSGDVLLVQYMEQYRPAEQGRCRLGGTGTTAGRGCEGHAGLQSTGSCGYHGADGGNDGVRLHSGSSGDGGDDCGYPDGTDRMFPQCGGGLQNH